MVRTLVYCLVAGCLAFSAAGATAGDLSPRDVFAMSKGETWATPLREEEMKELRGGFSGVAFRVVFSGNAEQAFLDMDTTGGVLDGTSTTGTTSDAQFTLAAVVGTFESFSGIVQIAQAIGDNLTVNNILNVQIVVVLSGQEANLNSIFGL